MSIHERKSDTDMIRNIWSAVKQHKTGMVPISKMVKLMTTETGMTEAEVESLLNNAIEDGFIEICGGNAGGSNRNNRKSPTRAYRIPTDHGEPISDLPHDLYCFECHTPRNLQKCSDCPRVFHEQCLQFAISDSNEAHTLSPTNQYENTNDSGIVASEPSVITNDATATQTESRVSREPSVESKPSLKTENANLGDDTKSSALVAHNQPDVICIGEVRPPSRRKKRLISSYNKHEANIHIDCASNENCSWCTSCRLQRSSALRDPPLQLNEMNFLLKFIFARIKTWITADTYSPLPFSSIPMPSKQEFEFFEKKCLKFPKTLEYIDKKLKGNGYKTLTEFQCDIMDIRHSIGILYGVKSAEYEASGYLLRDCAFELSEIRKCPDCYRHSNEKTNELWFCKPCIPRHELVFAKQIGYSHWPAKVIKVENGRYDVRFFGNQHLRAVIDAIHVLPIDTDITSLKIKKTAGFNKAMDELHRHQELLQWPLGHFSYEAERQNPVDPTALRPSTENKKNRGLKGKKSLNVSIGAEGDTILEVTTASFNVTKASNISASNGTVPERSSIMSQISPVVRLKRTKNNLSVCDTINKNTIDVSPSKKSRPNWSSTPLKKRAIARGRRRSTISDYSNPNENNKKSTKQSSQTSRSATMNESDPSTPTNQTNGQCSSTEAPSLQQSQSLKQGTHARLKSKIGKPKQDIVDNLMRELQAMKTPPAACSLAVETLQAEMERSADRIKQLTEKQSRTISETKKKQWCYYCEKEAIYHCCWNTAYCSTECQQKHWQMEHKKTCRRKR